MAAMPAMPSKRRRGNSTNHAQPKAKRGKFTLDSAHLPTITTNGAVLVTGAGDMGQLGLGPDVMEKLRPAAVEIEQEIVDITAGGMHTVCLTKDGKVVTFGCNDEGALGRITTDQEDAEFLPGLVELPGKVVQISAGDSHTAALLDDGRVFAWGTFRDSHGNMGLTPKGNEKLPYEIMSEHFIMKIASGADHIVFLTKHGEVYTCGCAEQGQLGRTTMRGSSRHARSGSGKGQLAKLLLPAPITLKASQRFQFDDVWAGPYSTFIKVAGENQMVVFGLNNYNQLGLKSLEPQYNPIISEEFSKYSWESICPAQHHTIGLTTEGKVYSIGRKEYGRLGLGKVEEDAKTLTEIPFFEKERVESIGTGSSTSFAITESGELYAWGMGTSGTLGTGDEEDCFEPTLVKSKQLKDRKAFRVKSGGQHTVILAMLPENNNQGDTNSKVKKK